MTSTKTRKSTPATARRSGRRRTLLWVAGAVALVAVLAGLYGIFSTASTPKTTGAGALPGAGRSYDVGQPGPGQAAPGFTLTDTTGQQVSLTDYEGKNVLLYFQEGLTCQPCWDQLSSLETDAAQVKAAGVDAVVSITTDPANLIARKTADMGLGTTVLSDPDLAVSKRYEANRYGMMGASRDGHSFILVGPDGTIRWRADYGGAPNYTMFIPVRQLLADLKDGATP
ncbi:MAG: peroxiredoxin family protein [Candidatus Methylomirabilales bacterium]